MARAQILKKNKPLQVTAKNLYSGRIPEKVHFEFILSSFWRKIGKIHSFFDYFSGLETKNFEAIALVIRQAFSSTLKTTQTLVEIFPFAETYI